MRDFRDFNIREADWNVDAEQLSNIRRLVFIVEQKVPQEAEWDGRDDSCWHWLATDLADLPMGTCRLLPDGQIGRMAVLSNYRRRGIGAALLRTAIEKARHLGFSNVYLHAQTHAIGFYQQLGFKKNGQELWRVDRDERTSWSTPIVVEQNNIGQVITSATNYVRSYDISSGKTIWKMDGVQPN